MEQNELNKIRTQLLDRRDRLSEVISKPGTTVQITNLLKEVDEALERMENNTYGICEVCHDPIEEDRLRINPLIKVCLDHLSKDQRRLLEDDLDLAHKIQKNMLPKNNLAIDGWQIYYHYEPAGAVSGDYCDIISANGNKSGLFFILGDVSGKGIAASMLMSHLHAMFHSLIPLEFSVDELAENASRLLCESTLSSHYATLLCIRADENGKIEICNAGHPPPLLIKQDGIEKLKATGLPIGLFCNSAYTINSATIESGEMLLLYSDGLTEEFFNDEEYGIERVIKIAEENNDLSPKELIELLLEDLNNYIAGTPKRDDLTIMAVKRI